MRVFNDFDDLKSAVGTEVGVSNWQRAGRHVENARWRLSDAQVSRSN